MKKKFSILIFNNFSQKKIKSINQKFDLLFKYQDISIFINKKFLKENSRNTLINNIFLLKKKFNNFIFIATHNTFSKKI